MENIKIKKESGFVVLAISLLILVVILTTILATSFLLIADYRACVNLTQSNQAYYAAEAGIEDALLRLFQGMSYSSAYDFDVGGAFASVSFSEVIAGSGTVTVSANAAERIRTLRAVYQTSVQEASFFYGVQAGDLGFRMDGNAVIYGNVFSNGTIIGASNTKIYGDAISAGPEGLIKNMTIKSTEGGGNAWAYRLEDCAIDGDAHYTAMSNCAVGGIHYAPEDCVEKETMPIGIEQINQWKVQAEAGGAIADYSLGGNDSASLGPIKINGNMNIDSNAILTITGTVWVTGDLNLSSNVIVRLDSSYGSASGVIVVDGKISIDSNVTLCGSEGYKKRGQCNPSIGSYLMLLSTKASADPGNPSIYATSNTKTAVLYAANGFIRLGSNANLKEATGYGIYMDSNAVVTYETGLADMRFSSGPGGTWEVVDWEEIP